MNDCERIVAMLERAQLAFALHRSPEDGGSYIELLSVPVEIDFGPAGDLESMTLMAA